MAPKRQHEGEHQPVDSGRSRKKQKIAVGRTIHFQAGSSIGAGVVTNSLTGLPGAIDVEKFAEARSFEIAAMQSAMETARGSSTQRAFQALPRSLRRRAASHDVRRVPVRLREKARAEMDPAKRKALGRNLPKRGKAKQTARAQNFLKRQRDKTWLETHLWHAKRMHMKNKWGYRLSETPTEKSFRPSHRASVHGSILHDASYISTISASGKQSVLEKMLMRCCDCQGAGPGAVRYTLGSRIHETHIYEPDAFPFNLIAPITIIWKPSALISPPSVTNSIQASTSNPVNKKRRRGKAKVPETVPVNMKPAADTLRTLWIRFHPSAWHDVWGAVQKAASLTLEQLRKEQDRPPEEPPANDQNPGNLGENTKETGSSKPPEEEDSIELEDLRSRLNCFEIMGPRSTQVLLGALKPVNEDDRAIFKEFWAQAKNLQSPGSVPRGMIIGMKVHDPRLNFPPKNAKAQTTFDGGLPGTSHTTAFTVYPTAVLARSELWDAVSGNALRRPRFKKKELDERRRQNLVPGTALQPLRQDDLVQILLIQRTVSPPNTSDPSLYGWTLLLPQHWAMPFFLSLTYTGTRVAGLHERRTQTFEASAPDFPFDYPSTSAYKREEDISACVERERWERKPPAKRVQWESVGTRSPWRADWEVVSGTGLAEAEDGLLPVQRENEMGTEKIWLLRGPEAPRIVEELTKAPDCVTALLASINELRAKRELPPLAVELLQGALVLVRLHMRARGAPDDLAGIYAMAPEDNENDNELSAGKSSLIGYVTTGSFALTQGKGAGLGAVSLSGILGLTHLTVKVKDRESAVCRAARVEVLAN